MSFRNKALFTALMLAGMALAGGTTAPGRTNSHCRSGPAGRGARSELPAVNQRDGREDQVADQDRQDGRIQGGIRRKDVGLLIDVRKENEFVDGFVPGAVNVPRGLIEFRIWKLVGFPDKTRMDTKMTLYCATGGRCALATKSLQDLGFTNAASVDMKFEDWVKAGYPVAKPAM